MNGLQILRERFPFPEERPSVAVRESGWFLECCREVLKRLSGNHTRVILELGSWCGLSTRYLASWNPAACVIALDTWEGGPDHVNDTKFQDLLPILWETFITSSWHLRDRIIPVRLSTREGLSLLRELEIQPDIVYIDASHEVEDVRLDLLETLEFFPKAHVVGDDWAWPSVRVGVRRALTSCDRYGELRYDYNCWWLEKEPCQDR